jgi:hypothetical protein
VLHYTRLEKLARGEHSSLFGPFSSYTLAIRPMLLYIQGTLTEGRISTTDLLIKVACFVKEANNIFNIKSS